MKIVEIMVPFPWLNRAGATAMHDVTEGGVL